MVLDISEDKLTSMLRTRIDSSDIEKIFNLLGKKFSVDILIVFDQNGIVHFNEILLAIDGINNKTLSARLKAFFDYELINRKIIPGIPARIEYYITKKGRSMIDIINQTGAFSFRYDVVHKTFGQKLRESNPKDSAAIEPFRLRY